MSISLEHEFENRKQEVMKNVVNAVTMKLWIDKQLSGVNLPEFLIDKKELQYRASLVADKVVNDMINANTLETAFDEAWDAVAPMLP